MKTSKLLEKARTVLDETGWCKGTLARHSKTGNLSQACAIGSLYAAAGVKTELDGGRWTFSIPTEQQDQAIIRGNKALVDAGRILFPDLRVPENGVAWINDRVAWINDRKDTTKAEVLAWFDAAIALAKVRESRERRAAARG